MEGTERSTASSSEEGRYRLLVDAMTDYAIYMLDPGGIIVSWNAGAQRFKGYSEAEILGQHFSRFFTEADRQAGLPERALRTAAAEGRFETEGWRIRKDGTRFWAHVVIDPIRLPTGELVGYAKITRDLSERRTAEEALRQSEEQFRLLVNGVTDYAIFMLDPSGRVTNWNLGAQRIKGYRPDEIVGEHFSRFYTPEDRARGEPERGLRTALVEGRFETEGWRVRKDGTRFRANVVIDRIDDDAGAVLGFAKITRDVTERDEAQRALNQANEALAQSQKMEAIGQLTGGIAHDFNNLLTAVLGSLELARKRVADDPAVLALIDNALKGVERGASLTQRMLAFARRQDLEPRPVDLRDLVDGMNAFLQRSLGPQVTIRTQFPDRLAPVQVDPVQLETALLNLFVNARDAMDGTGEILVEASEERVTDGGGELVPGRYVRLAVIDSGEGMDEATLARAAEPFFTTKGIGKGTGLGLSMVHGLVRQSGGRLAIRSSKGAGSTVELWLPQSPDAPAAPLEAAEAEPSAAATGPLVILAVDDDGLVLMNTTAMLEDLGHTALEAFSADEALEHLRAGHRIDLVITDHAMPRMTGSQLAEVIRAEWPEIPIVLATGYAELPPGGDRSLQKLAKPFGMRELEAAVCEAMAGATRAPARIRRPAEEEAAGRDR
ncbi:PAS domain-containing sensor histidine kinase [Aurantimonas sp. HBX-1]|uniref:hybrid sensor histidine kinase/response regulator n=1 Tax=Aurantimonas sp. HBX-1 TaxID=2906072 RepID=UPI001F1A0AC5|nr:PAS domain-containing sensor histidine kinase [Aurantimonas sp. HBX-1]UIJ74137.1 PAS domain S-box protein [Aurantimonas sp. HBX-1]